MPLPDLALVAPTRDLLAQVLEWRNHPDVTRWLLRTTVDPERFTRTWLDSVDDPRSAGVLGLLEGRVVATGSVDVRDGMGQLGHEDEFERSEGELGYLVDPAYAGRGVATVVAAAMLDAAFGDLGLRRVTAGCFADNVGSWRVMEKLGMRREQHGVADSWHGELGWVDGYTYGILAEEWRQR